MSPLSPSLSVLALLLRLAEPAAVEPTVSAAEPTVATSDPAVSTEGTASEPGVPTAETPSGPGVPTQERPSEPEPSGLEPTEQAPSEPEPFVAAGPSPAAEPVPVPGPAEPPKGARVRATVTDGFGVDSADGRFGLSASMLLQMRYFVEHQAGDVDNGFALRLARAQLQGHLWGDRLTFQLMPELAGNVRLLDANATINLHPAFSLLVGQYRPWFTRGFPTNLPVQAQLDRGPVLDAFRIDRDVGVTALGHPFEGRMEYYLGVFSGEGLDRSAPRDPQPLLTARVVAAPLGAVAYDQTQHATADRNLPFRFAVGLNAATNEIARVGTTIDSETGEEITTPLPRLRTVVLGGDVAVYGWRLMAMGEGFWRADRFRGAGRDDAWGAYGTLSVNVWRKRLDLVTRVGALRLEGEPAAHMPLEPGVNLYFAGNHAKLQLRYQCDLGLRSGECIGQGAQLQGQLWF